MSPTTWDAGAMVRTAGGPVPGGRPGDLERAERLADGLAGGGVRGVESPAGRRHRSHSPPARSNRTRRLRSR